VILLLLACTEHSLSLFGGDPLNGEPDILANPAELDFGHLRSDETATRTLQVQNVGSALLALYSAEIPDSAAFSVPATGLVELEPGGVVELELSFSPDAPGELTGTLILSSDDPDTPELEVDLLGGGRTPRLEISPAEHDFGELALGCSDELELTLQNVGVEDLLIDEIAASGPGYSLLEVPALPLELGPGAYDTVTLAFEPGAAGLLEGSLDTWSDDPRGLVSATQTGSGLSVGEASETFPVDEDPPVDLIFAIDQSGSMDDDATRLGENFSAFVSALETSTDNWRIGVVTYDTGCFNNGILKSSTANVEDKFEEAVVLGEDLDIQDDEALLKLLDRALDQTDGGCNAGFLRSDALLHLVVVSDEPERSWEQAAAWTWDYWLPRLQEHVTSDERLVISGVVDTEDCNEGAEGYLEAIEATGGEALSICSGDWSAHVSSLAEVSVAGSWLFTLAEVPAPGSITVEVDGTSTSTGWSYDESLNAVSFEDLVGASEVTIAYALSAPCD
jgi:hypothetical protein